MLYRCLLLVGLSVPAVPLEQQPAGGPVKDISCNEKGEYLGGIDRKYSLTIGGLKEKTWNYTFATFPSLRDDANFSGTYEQVEGLAIFTGKSAKKNEEIRFGINYGFPGGKVNFNGFFPESEQSLRYHRQWFRKAGNEWKPAEELILTTPRTPPKGKWEVALKGERITWDEAGKSTKEKIDATVIYNLVEGSGYNRSGLKEPGLNQRLPHSILPVLTNNRLEAVLFHGEGGPGGMLRGFHPYLADLQHTR